ncbi:hypothetical protein D3C83_39520 [compost metagenome]
MPIQAGSITRMSSERSLHRPSSARGYSPAIHAEYGRRWPLGSCNSFRISTKSSPARALCTSAVHDIVPEGPVLGSFLAYSASSTGDFPSVLENAPNWSTR